MTARAEGVAERVDAEIVREVLEALCVRDGLTLDSDADPGTPARNYELAMRLGIGQVFGLEGGVVAEVELDKLRRENARLKAAILDIDAHANAIGSDEDGFNSGGYIVSLGAIHRALGILGRTGIKQREHAVSIELAHGDGCVSCQQMKQVVFDAFEAAGVQKFKESRAYG